MLCQTTPQTPLLVVPFSSHLFSSLSLFIFSSRALSFIFSFIFACLVFHLLFRLLFHLRASLFSCLVFSSSVLSCLLLFRLLLSSLSLSSFSVSPCLCRCLSMSLSPFCVVVVVCTLKNPVCTFQSVPVCTFSTSPCVRSKRLRVYRDHLHMLKPMCAWCRCTR